MAAISELDADECRALLGQHHFGRVGFVSDDMPVILPVNYVLDDDTIVFRTDPGLKLTETPMRHVAFEIDSAGDSAPWSVLVQGFAREITDVLGAKYESLRELPIPVQAPGDKGYWVAVEIQRISGRRIH